MKESTKNIIKVAAVLLVLAIIVSSVFALRSCSAPPDYETMRARVEELIEASFDVNDVVWGEGLETYERVAYPTRTLWESGKTYVDENGAEKPLNYYYYYALGANDEIVAYRAQSSKADFSYALVSAVELDKQSLEARYPLAEGEAASAELYSKLYTSENGKQHVYLIPYVEPAYDLYYVSSDPTDYDYVLPDSKYASVDDVKALIRTVYSSDYAESLDQVLFDGVMEGDFVQKARYTTIQSSRGAMFASLNTYEPLFTERRVYLYSSARINRANSNSSMVVVDFYSYLPSDPTVVDTASLTFTLQDGVWYLATPTY